MLFKDFIEENRIIEDGAMGTYYSKITGKQTNVSEWANIEDAATIENIHKEYIKAGANLILTNTFSVNTLSLNISFKEVKTLIKKGFNLARKAAKDKEVFVGADIGPIPELMDGKMRQEEKILEEYKYIIDIFYEQGARIFVFETFSDIKYLEELSQYIKNKNEDNFIIFQLAVTSGGNTRKGLKAYNLVRELKKYETVDVYGFNCGVGPTHLRDFLKKLDIKNDRVSGIPNAGYPEIINKKTVYTQNADYFSEIMTEIKGMGVTIIGGCCGTTPLHIKKIAEKSEQNYEFPDITTSKNMKIPFHNLSFDFKDNNFKQRLDQGKFTVAVELDPPFAADIHSFKEKAYALKNTAVDIISIADSPLGKESLDSVITAAKLKKEIGIEAMPYLTCRDSNMIGLKSKLMAGYIEGIRNLLLVTGNPIPGGDRKKAVSVFNLNSFKLMQLVQELNYDKLQENSFYYGGALNLNVKNKDKEWERMQNKINAGAGFFFTQPIFEKETINYLQKKDIPKGIKIFGGILPPVSYDNARFLNNEFPGINIPDYYISRFSKNMPVQEAEKIGIDIALDIFKKIEKNIDGLYLIPPFNNINLVKKILTKI